MPANHLQLGKRGENLAMLFLKEHGLLIEYQNYRWGRAEIDIIARQNTDLRFIEVKTRSWFDDEAAQNAVNHKKQRLIMGSRRLVYARY